MRPDVEMRRRVARARSRSGDAEHLAHERDRRHHRVRVTLSRRVLERRELARDHKARRVDRVHRCRHRVHHRAVRRWILRKEVPVEVRLVPHRVNVHRAGVMRRNGRREVAEIAAVRRSPVPFRRLDGVRPARRRLHEIEDRREAGRLGRRDGRVARGPVVVRRGRVGGDESALGQGRRSDRRPRHHETDVRHARIAGHCEGRSFLRPAVDRILQSRPERRRRPGRGCDERASRELLSRPGSRRGRDDTGSGGANQRQSNPPHGAASPISSQRTRPHDDAL